MSGQPKRVDRSFFFKETALPPFFAWVPGERVSGKQGKCIDTCNFRAAEMLVGVPQTRWTSGHRDQKKCCLRRRP